MERSNKSPWQAGWLQVTVHSDARGALRIFCEYHVKEVETLPECSYHEYIWIAWLVQKVQTWQVSVQACWCGIGRVCYSNNRILRLFLGESMSVNVWLPDMNYVWSHNKHPIWYAIDIQYIHTCRAESTTEYVPAYVVFKQYVTIYEWELPLDIYIASIWFFVFQ